GSGELWRRLLALAPGQRVWVAGSTHPGEEGPVLDAHRAALGEFPELVLVIAPRHPERTREVQAFLERRGWPSVRRSELPAAVTNTAGPVPPVVILDTVGGLAMLYSIADVVFVGGSLVPMGGHNVLEAAQRRKPVLIGPHTTNFRESAGLLESAGAAIVVRDATDLSRELRRLLADPDLRLKLGDAGFEAVASRHGAVRETLDLVGRYLYPEARALILESASSAAGRRASPRDRRECWRSPAAATAVSSARANGSTGAACCGRARCPAGSCPSATSPSAARARRPPSRWRSSRSRRSVTVRRSSAAATGAVRAESRSSPTPPRSGSTRRNRGTSPSCSRADCREFPSSSARTVTTPPVSRSSDSA